MTAKEILGQTQFNQIVDNAKLLNKSDEEIQALVKTEATKAYFKQGYGNQDQKEETASVPFMGDSTTDKIARGLAETTSRVISMANYVDDQVFDNTLISDDFSQKNAQLQHILEEKREETSREGLDSKRLEELNKLDQEIQRADTVYENAKAGLKKMYDVISHPSEWTIQGTIAELNPVDPANAISIVTGGIGGKVAQKFGASLSTKISFGVADGVISGGVSEYAIAKGSHKSDEEANKAFVMGSTVGTMTTVPMATASTLISSNDILPSMREHYRPKEDGTPPDPVDLNKNLKEKTNYQMINEDLENNILMDATNEEIVKDIQEVARIEQSSMDAHNDLKETYKTLRQNGAKLQELIQVEEQIVPSKDERSISTIINGHETSPKLSGFRIVGVLEDTINNSTESPDVIYTKLVKDHMIGKDLANAFIQSYKEKTTETLVDFIDQKLNLKFETKYQMLQDTLKKDINNYNLSMEADQVNWQNSVPKSELDNFIDMISKNEEIPQSQKDMLYTLNQLGFVDELIHTNIHEKYITPANGVYDKQDGKIAIDDGSPFGDLNVQTLVHEYIHSATTKLIDADENFKADISTIMADFKSKLSKKDQGQYAFKNEFEFVAEAYSNPEIAQKLSNTKIDPKIRKKLNIKDTIVSVWDYVIDRFFQSIKDTTGKRIDFDADSHMATLNEVMARKIQEFEDVKNQRIDDGSSLKENLKTPRSKRNYIEGDDSFENLQTHPRYEELLEMRQDIKASEIRSKNKLVKQGEVVKDNDKFGGEDKTYFVPPTLEKNWLADFELTMQDVKNIRAGKVNTTILSKLKRDLDTLDNDPNYKLDDNLQFHAVKLGDNKEATLKDIKESLESKRGIYKDIEYTQENWNTLFPESKIETPLGTIKLGENQFEKLDPNIPDPKNPDRKKQDRRHHLSYIHQTIKDPAFAVTKEDGAKKVFFKEFETEKGLKQYSSVTVDIDGIDVKISSHPMDYRQILKEVKNNETVFIAPEVTTNKATNSHSTSGIVEKDSITKKDDKSQDERYQFSNHTQNNRSYREDYFYESLHIPQSFISENKSHADKSYHPLKQRIKVIDPTGDEMYINGVQKDNAEFFTGVDKNGEMFTIQKKHLEEYPFIKEQRDRIKGEENRYLYSMADPETPKNIKTDIKKINESWEIKVDKWVDTGYYKYIFGIPEKIIDKLHIKDGLKLIAPKIETNQTWFKITEMQNKINESMNDFKIAKHNIYDQANGIKKSLQNLSEQDNKDLLKALNGDMAVSDLPDGLQQTYKTFRKVIDQNANELVELGLLKEDEKIKDYVKRYYKQYMEEVKDFQHSVAFDKLKKRKDLTYDQRVELGMVEDAGFTIANTIAEQNIQIQKAKVLRTLAQQFGKDEVDFDGDIPRDYVKMDNQTVKGDVYKWGALAGKYIPKELKNELGNARIIEQQFRIWEDGVYPIVDHLKVNMTVKNPATHLYNIGSNLLLSFLNGDMVALSKLLFMRATKPNKFNKLVKEANEFGLNSFLDDVEERQIVLDPENKKRSNIIATIFKELYMAQGTKTGDVARKLYDWEDKIFKLAGYYRLVNEGMNKKEAFKKSSEVYVDYSTPLPASLKFLDKGGFMPFLHYQYKATPAVAKVILKHPIRSVILTTGIASIGASRFQDQEDEYLKPEWANDRILSMFWMKEWTRLGNGYYFNSGRIVPGTKLDMELGGFWKGAGYLIDGKTPLGYTFTSKYDGDMERYAKTTLTAMENYMPSLTYGRYAQRFAKIGLGEAGVIEPPKNKVTGEDDTAGEVVERAMGVRKFNESKEARRIISEAKKRKKYEDAKGADPKETQKAVDQVEKDVKKALAKFDLKIDQDKTKKKKDPFGFDVKMKLDF